jgi:hypothetical protein
MNFKLLSSLLPQTPQKEEKKEDTPPNFYIEESADDIQILLDELNEKTKKSGIRKYLNMLVSCFKHLLKPTDETDSAKDRKLPTPK